MVHLAMSKKIVVWKGVTIFDFTDTGYCFDTPPGRIIYFNLEKFWKYIKAVQKYVNDF